MVRCPNCGVTSHYSNASYCTKCGADLRIHKNLLKLRQAGLIVLTVAFSAVATLAIQNVVARSRSKSETAKSDSRPPDAKHADDTSHGDDATAPPSMGACPGGKVLDEDYGCVSPEDAQVYEMRRANNERRAEEEQRREEQEQNAEERRAEEQRERADEQWREQQERQREAEEEMRRDKARLDEEASRLRCETFGQCY